jgi:hypothetical protein
MTALRHTQAALGLRSVIGNRVTKPLSVHSIDAGREQRTQASLPSGETLPGAVFQPTAQVGDGRPGIVSLESQRVSAVHGVQ